MKHLLLRPVLALAVCASIALAGCGSGDSVNLDVDDGHPPFVTDAQGRALIFHGVNVISAAKSDPEQIPRALDAPLAKRISNDWGMNLVRYLVFWNSLEPTKGDISQAYLDKVQEKIELLTDQQVYVVIDMHQDVYAARFCCDGAPPWAIRDDGEPFTEQPQWALNYFQPAVKRSFDNFWAYTEGNDADLQDEYMKVWQAVAERFKDNPYVIGYDLMNEPHPGSLFDIQDLNSREPNPDGTSAEFERQYLQPFYQRVINAIREVDPDGWIFYEPRYGGPANGAPSYMTAMTDPREGRNRIVYYPHLYSATTEIGGAYDPATDPTVESWAHYRAQEIADRREPAAIGEWGVTGVNGSQLLLAKVLDMSDQLMIGWTYWSMDPGGYGFVDAPVPGGDSSTWVENDKADLLVRPFPQAVAGQPISFGYDTDTRVFTLKFDTKPGVKGPTEIFVPVARHYPEGIELTSTDPDGTWSWKMDPKRPNILLLTVDHRRLEHAFTISPKR
ncbi:MAG: cellulase family glycosylhydrolase [Myxococcales bacterium]|nr:cellulase family glycosylhydrolase [Myxococcales bacterium]